MPKKTKMSNKNHNNENDSSSSSSDDHIPPTTNRRSVKKQQQETRITSVNSFLPPGLNEDYVEFPDITLENDASIITDNGDDNAQCNTTVHAAIESEEYMSQNDMNSEENRISTGMISTDNNTYISTIAKLKDGMSSTKVAPLISNLTNDQPNDIDEKSIAKAICSSSDDKAETGKDFNPDGCASEEFPQGSCTMYTPRDKESDEDSCY